MKREIACDKCGGRGIVELSDSLDETLSLVPKRGTISAHELAAKIPGITANAQNNRLEKLRALGFVTRTRAGKFWRYSRV